MVEMIWKEPPPAVSSEKAPVLAALQKNPGRWALVQSGYKSSSGAAPWRKLGCEATHRRSAEGKAGEYDIYARWPEDAPAAATADAKSAVAAAVATGTALKPPPSPTPRAPAPAPAPADTAGGFTKFIASQRASTQARTQ